MSKGWTLICKRREIGKDVKSHSTLRKSGTGVVLCCLGLGLFFGPLVKPVDSRPTTVSSVSFAADESGLLMPAPTWMDSAFPPPARAAGQNETFSIKNVFFVAPVGDLPPLPFPAPSIQTSGSTAVFSDMELGIDQSPESTPRTSDKLTLPIAIVLLLGTAWRFYTSPAYSKLYWSLYGPLDEY